MPRAINADGPWTDETHVTAQNADQLRQAVEPGVAQQADETRGERSLIGEVPHAIVRRGAEQVGGETPTCETDARLSHENGASEADIQQGGDQH